jgi:hypothetical protein
MVSHACATTAQLLQVSQPEDDISMILWYDPNENLNIVHPDEFEYVDPDEMAPTLFTSGIHSFGTHKHLVHNERK